MRSRAIQIQLRRLANPAKARGFLRFFKTGPGEYGEGDQFLGITVPKVRKVARSFRSLPRRFLRTLLLSPVHEERLLALLILVDQFARAVDEPTRRGIYEFYLGHTQCINNWDLVDLSAEKIVGPYLVDKDQTPLYLLAVSDVLWERRIAILSTFHYIKQGRFNETLRISRMLLHDSEDLIHKAAGWMLREVGKRDRAAEESFLKKHYHQMPRTMLRYAIERFPESVRRKYLRGEIPRKNVDRKY